MQIFHGVMMVKKNNNEKIEVKNDFQHARLRTEVYLGSRAPHTQEVVTYENGKPILKELTWVPAIYTAFREIIDNALDEIAHGYGNRIDIDYDEESSVMGVSDNGRGIPITYDKDLKNYLCTVALSQARAGRNFGDRGEWAGLNGLGAACTNFCSEWFVLDIWRDGKHFHQEFTDNNGAFNELIVKKPKIKDCSENKTGTKIKFKLSKLVFESFILPEEFVRARVFEIALSNPKLKVFYNGEQIKTKKTITQTFGIPNAISFEINETDFKSTWVLIPDFTDEQPIYHTSVNNIYSYKGGEHIEAFKKSFYPNFRDVLNEKLKRQKLTVRADDISKGLLVYNIIKMKAPTFDGQNKVALNSEEPVRIINEFFKNNKDFFSNLIKNNKEWFETIAENCRERTNAKNLKNLENEERKIRKKVIPKLLEANSKRRRECVLFLFEGDSAQGNFDTERNPMIHAGLPIQGKRIPNVLKKDTSEAIKNETIQQIINTVGLSPTKKIPRDKLNYGKIYIATDMDQDGYNIMAMLINVLYYYWPELFDINEEPFFYHFQTPFIIGIKGNQRKYWYGKDYPEKFEKEWPTLSGWKARRAKGLGTLEPIDWKHALDNPVVYPIFDDGHLKDTLELIFGKGREEDRKTWVGVTEDSDENNS